MHRSAPFFLVALLLLPGHTVLAAEWLENLSLLVKVDGKPSSVAHIYDSDDYQRMLLVMDDRPTSAVLDLGQTTVYGIPSDSVCAGGDGVATSADALEEYLTDLEQRDGTLAFDWEDTTVLIEPLPPVIGPVDLKRIFAVKPAYGTAATNYQPKPTDLAILKAIDTETELRVYFGTWCHLCKNLVPPVIGTLEKVGNSKLRASYFGVDEELTAPADEIKKYFITATPTVLVLRDGKEIGRIEEEATTTIEAELVAILGAK